MKFCDKLPKLRKNNNLSQEQLADKLGVSRQAVSKWESGTSYPDMDKLIQICGILNCTLDELLDDGAVENKQPSNKINFNNYLQDFLKFITKISNMFSSMTFKEKIKCIFEMLILSFLTFIIGIIIYCILNTITSNLIDILPYYISNRITYLFRNLYLIILIILGIIVILHLFKIRYLDYFITIEDKNVKVKSIEEPIDKKENKYYIEKPKEKIIIRDPEHSTFSFFNLLGKTVTLIIKLFAIIFLVPVLLTFFGLIIMAVISLYHTIYGIIFLMITLAVIGAIIISYQIIEFMFDFITNIKINLKRVFIVIMIGIVLLAIGIGLTLSNFLNYKYIDNYDDLNASTSTEYIDIHDNTHFDQFISMYNVEYVIDNLLSNAKLEITTYGNIDYSLDHDMGLESEYYYIHLKNFGFFNNYHMVINDIKNKKYRDYNDKDLIKVKIYLSQDNYDILKNNDYVIHY